MWALEPLEPLELIEAPGVPPPWARAAALPPRRSVLATDATLDEFAAFRRPGTEEGGRSSRVRRPRAALPPGGLGSPFGGAFAPPRNRRGSGHRRGACGGPCAVAREGRLEAWPGTDPMGRVGRGRAALMQRHMTTVHRATHDNTPATHFSVRGQARAGVENSDRREQPVDIRCTLIAHPQSRGSRTGCTVECVSRNPDWLCAYTTAIYCCKCV